MQRTSVLARKVPPFVPLLNPLMAGLVRLGIPMGADMRLLTVRGRTTGRDRTTPVAVFDYDGALYLFGTFGDTQWTRNLRVAGEAVLARGRRPRQGRRDGAHGRGSNSRAQGCAGALSLDADAAVPPALLRPVGRRSHRGLPGCRHAPPGLPTSRPGKLSPFTCGARARSRMSRDAAPAVPPIRHAR